MTTWQRQKLGSRCQVKRALAVREFSSYDSNADFTVLSLATVCVVLGKPSQDVRLYSLGMSPDVRDGCPPDGPGDVLRTDRT